MDPIISLQHDTDAAHVPHRTALARILALAYTLLIAYASLQPFRGWRVPPEEILHFLGAPWPRYITVEDLVVNVVAYVPLGFFLALGLGARFGGPVAALAAAILAALLSLAMEGLQMFLPTRIASNVDLLTNGAGGLFGAMAAPLLSPAGFPGRRLAAWRERRFTPGAVTDTGLVIVCLWLFTHLHPTAQLFGTGNLRATFELPPYFIHTPRLLFSAEAVIVLLNLLGLGLLVTLLSRDSVHAFRLVASVIIAGLAVKAVAAVALFSAPGLMTWLTPGVAVGLATGALLLYPLVRMPRAPRLIAALLCLGAALTVINFAPDNPYQTIPPGLASGGTTHLLRFSNIVRALSELWPFIAITYLIAAAASLARAGRGYRL